jgi:hypothetical protein
VPLYRRPTVLIEAFADDLGELVPYGSRYWGTDGEGKRVEPPAGVYSACTHPQRFEPVAVVGHALVDYLAAAYEVDRTDSVNDGRAETRLTPRSGGGAPLTFVFGNEDLPGVRVQAGWRFEGLWPDCGCDACDDDVNYLLDDLENTVLTIVRGGMSEWRSGPDPSSHLVVDDAGNPIGDEHVPWTIHVQFDGPLETGGGGDRWSAGEPEPIDMPVEPHRWPAWPPTSFLPDICGNTPSAAR